MIYKVWHIMHIMRMIVNGRLEGMWKEVVMACFRLLSEIFPGGTKEIPRMSCPSCCLPDINEMHYSETKLVCISQVLWLFIINL